MLTNYKLPNINHHCIDSINKSIGCIDHILDRCHYHNKTDTRICMSNASWYLQPLLQSAKGRCAERISAIHNILTSCYDNYITSEILDKDNLSIAKMALQQISHRLRCKDYIVA